MRILACLMRRTAHVVLAAMVLWQSSARAQETSPANTGDDTAAAAPESEAEPKVAAGKKSEPTPDPASKKKKRKRRSPEEEQELERVSGRSARDSAEPAAADLTGKEPSSADTAAKYLPPRRYSYILGAVLIAAGASFGFIAQGDAKRAETLSGAAEAVEAQRAAQASAGVANVLYGLGAAAVLYAVVLELLPEPLAEKASLTFRF